MLNELLRGKGEGELKIESAVVIDWPMALDRQTRARDVGYK